MDRWKGMWMRRMVVPFVFAAADRWWTFSYHPPLPTNYLNAKRRWKRLKHVFQSFPEILFWSEILRKISKIEHSLCNASLFSTQLTVLTHNPARSIFQLSKANENFLFLNLEPNQTMPDLPDIPTYLTYPPDLSTQTLIGWKATFTRLKCQELKGGSRLRSSLASKLSADKESMICSLQTCFRRNKI